MAITMLCGFVVQQLPSAVGINQSTNQPINQTKHQQQGRSTGVRAHTTTSQQGKNTEGGKHS
jgi:hypothetical protein